MGDLGGRHALVTGGGSGVGAAVALALAEAGARVTIVGRRQVMLEATAALNGSIRWATGDVGDAAAMNSLLRDAANAYGEVDIAVANAGAATSKPFARTDATEFRAMLEVNLVGVFNTFRASVESMRKVGHGRMIAIASTAGLKGYPYVAGYCAAKHGVVGLVRALALELAETSITVNAICPGFTDTPMLDETIKTIMDKTGRSRAEAERELKKNNPQNRFIQPSEIAAAVLFLCSPGAGALTGQSLSISGGEI